MKKLFLLFIPFSFIPSLFGQTSYQYVFHEPHGVVQAIDVNQDSFLVAAGSTESCPEGFVAYFDSKGVLYWKKLLNEYLSPATNVFFDKENNIIVVGTKSIADDYGFPTDGIYILKLDIYGNTIFYKRFRRGSYLSEKVYAVQLADSTYLAGVQNNLFWANKNGDSLSTKTLQVDKIIDLSIMSDSTVLVLARKIAIIINLKGDIIKEIPAQEDFIAASSKNDTTWILGAKNIWIFNGDNNSPQLYSLQNITNPKGITCKRDSSGVIIWGNHGAAFTILNFMNGAWSRSDIDAIVGTRVFDVKNIRKKYYFAGSDLWEDMPRGNAMYGAFVSANTEGYFRTAEITSDIGIVNVNTAIASPLDTFDRIIRADTLLAFSVSGWFNATIEVINRSDYNVNKFVLSSSSLGSFNCAEGRAFYTIIDSVNIKPYETKSINIRFNDYTRFYTDISNDNRLERCFFVAAPNHTFDENPTNNSFCKTILSKTNHVRLLAHTISIFPNPAYNIIQIQTENNIQIESLQLFNIAGQLQNITFNVIFNQALLYRGNLSAGLYWLKIQTKEGFVMKKVIFQ